MRLVSCVVTLAVLDTLGACQPAYPPPPGYVEACYGPDYGKRLTGPPASFTMRMAATEQQWPALSAKLKAFGAAHDLEVFDTSMNPEGLRMFEVSLCSAKGLFVWADKRLWEGMPDRDPDHIQILLFAYRGTYDWRKIAADLESSFHDWPGTVETAYPESPARAPNKGLERP